MTKKYASSFAQFMNEAKEKKAQGLLEYEETGTLTNPIDKIKDKANVRETDKLKIYSKDELMDMASAINKAAWVEGLFSKKANELAAERKTLNDERKSTDDEKKRKDLLTQLLILSQAEMAVRAKDNSTISIEQDDDDFADDIIPGEETIKDIDDEEEEDLAAKGQGGLTQDKSDVEAAFGKPADVEDETTENEDDNSSVEFGDKDKN